MTPGSSEQPPFSHAPVAVVGGGFSGVMTAVQLARRNVPVRLFDDGSSVGRGIAYSTPDERHLLNVPAGNMSAWPDEPDDFRSWLGTGPGSFARRRDFGSYVEGILAAHPSVRVERGRVVALSGEGGSWRLGTEDGRSIAASRVVLALGNEPPHAFSGWDDMPLIANPWSRDARAALAEVAESGGDVLLIGTGLTMIDVMLSLEGFGFAGRALAVSRRGLLPRAHAPSEPSPVTLDELPRSDLLALFRWVRRRSEQVGFRAAIDSLRPHTAALWQGLGERQISSFLRHARPWFDVHRHRIAPEIAERLRHWIAEGRLEVAAGRLRRGEDGEVVIARRGGGERTLRPALIVNCTGPLGDVRRTANPLLRALIDDEEVGVHPRGLGLLTDPEDRAAPGLFALGPLTKSMYWEITAVPDIRAQAQRVADTIAKELAPHG